MSSRSETGDFLFFLVKLAVLVMLVRTLLISPFNIPSESMQPRLLIGDYLLVSKWPYGYSRYSLPWNAPLIKGRLFGRDPERGDVVVFAAPANPKEDWIKRVIGLPGDTVQMRGGVIMLNGKRVPKQRIADLVIPVTPNMVAAAEADGLATPCSQPSFEIAAPGGGHQCRYPRFRETLPNGRSYDVLDLVDSSADNTPAYVIPKDHIFVMGDNRDRSADSRIAVENGGVGVLATDRLVGKAFVTYFSTGGDAVWFKPWTWLNGVRPERIGGSI